MKNISIPLLLVLLFMMIILALSCNSRKSLPIKGPFTLNEQEQAGEIVFMQHCQRCHPSGEPGLGPAIYPVPKFAKRFQIRHGVGAMPAFDEDHISDEEVEQVLAYLKALNKNS